MLRQEKIDAVAKIKALFESSGAFFITDYQGLNVADMTRLRRSLRANQVQYLVAKNTLFRRAAADAGVTGLDKFLDGPTAVAFAQADPSAAARVLHDSYREKELPRF